MNHDATLFTDLTVGLSLAWFAGFVAVRLRMNPILGYIIAGMIIASLTSGFESHASTIEGLATLGLVFMLFSLGLEFSFEELCRSGASTVLTNAAATAAGTAVSWCGFVLERMAHPITAALTTAVSSTAIGVALLKDWKSEGEGASHFAITQQVVQDLFAIILLVITAVPINGISFAVIALPLLKAVLFVAIAFVVGRKLLHGAVLRILKSTSTDRLFISFAAISLIAATAGHLFGLSYEFGAFIAGAVISASPQAKMIVPIVGPFRAIFVALFFVSVGMLFNTQTLLQHAIEIIAIGTALVVLRFCIWYYVGRRNAHERKIAALAALAMTAMGEFNAVLINEASIAHRIDATEQQVLLGIVLFSIMVTMIFAPHLPHIVNRIHKPALPEGEITAIGPIVAIIGFGRVGQAIGHVLRDAGIEFTALEAHRSIIGVARNQGFEVVMGEPLDPVALARVIVPSIRYVMTTVAEAHVNMAVCEHVAQRYDVELIARAGHGLDVAKLIDDMGVSMAFVPENEGALVFARGILEALEFSDDDIERYLEEERRASRSLAVSMEHEHHHLFKRIHADEPSEFAEAPVLE